MTRDAELRYTPSNVAVATLTLAVNRPFKNQNGEHEADFINVVIWRQQAENLANWAKKGAQIGIIGRIQTRSYDNQQGQRDFSRQENPFGQTNPMDISDDDLPF